MSGGNRSSNNSTVEEIDSKLKQYMLINKQISKTLTTQRIEIANLKNSLRISAADGISLQVECHKWMKMFYTIRDAFIAHIHSLTGDLQIHAETINRLSEDAEGCILLVDQIAAGPISAPRNNDESRRVSRSFQLTKNRSQRRNDESSSMHTIEEDEEDESAHEELKEDGDASGNDTNNNSSTQEEATDEDSKENLEEIEIEKSAQTGKENTLEESQVIAEKSCESHEECNESDEESDECDEESGESDEESGESDEESGENDEESCESDEESGDSDEETGENDGESEASDQEKGVSDSESESDVVSVVENEVVNRMDHEDASDAENNSDSVEQMSILTANVESTIKNNDSDKENYTTNGSISTRSMSRNSKSVISVDSDSSRKSTPAKSLKKLPANKKKVNVHDQSISLTYTSMEEQSINLTYVSMEEQSLVSSTPYRSSNVDNGASVDTATPAKTSSSKSSKSNTSATLQISTSSSVTSTRPKRKAAPVILSEPKLNTKLRRPR